MTAVAHVTSDKPLPLSFPQLAPLSSGSVKNGPGSSLSPDTTFCFYKGLWGVKMSWYSHEWTSTWDMLRCVCVRVCTWISGLGGEKETEVRVRERQRVGYTVNEVRTIDSDEVRENKAAHFLLRGGRWPGQTRLRLVFVAEVWPSQE